MLHANIIPHLKESWASPALEKCSSLELATYLILFTLILCLIRAVYLLYFHPLASFDGPYKAVLSTWWQYPLSKSGKIEEAFEQLHQKYSMFYNKTLKQAIDSVDRHTRASNRTK
jgi:hypothetical protein